MARQSGIADASFCEEVFARFDHADGIRAALKRELKLQRLSEAQFYALVFLYSRDPVPVSPVDLAYYMERRSVRVILKQLASMDLVESAFTEGRRTRPFGLTDEGRHHTAFSIYRYLQAVTRLSAETGLKNG
ncbi:hypothetical protein DB347_15030 [Opitutaceae bacterium EW11]|nr:hypothetical protein DB347_15030 [Opitutaceae bacterium EW11]